MNKKQKVVVTGAGGYIGRNVVKTLLDMGMDVVAVDIRVDGIDDRATACQYDIFNSNENTYEELGKPDVCLHLAWLDGFVHNADSHLLYLPKHYAFLRNLVESGLTRVAVLGTMHEVGYHEGAIDEYTPNNPRSMYGIAKNSLHQALCVLQGIKPFELQWLRAFYIYGDDLKNHSIFTKILQASQEGKKEFPFNSGLNKYDFTEIKDLALEIACAVTQTEIDGVINCCLGKPVALKDKVEAFIENNNLDIKLNYGAFPDRPYDSPVIYGDVTKIKQIVDNWISNGMNPLLDNMKCLAEKFH